MYEGCIFNIYVPSVNTPYALISFIAMQFVSVSDLLDYINPNHEAKGRDVTVKRRSHITKVSIRFTGYVIITHQFNILAKIIVVSMIVWLLLPTANYTNHLILLSLLS